jgi:hypothetical protein
MKYKFQIKDGYIADGSIDIVITNHIAKIEDITPAIQLLIDAHGGQLVKEKPKKKKAKPVKWTGEEAAKEVTDLLEKTKRMNDEVTK